MSSQELCSSFSRIRSLHLLSLGGNKLRTIPDSIGLLSQLQLLNLCDNFLEAIPSSVARLHNLKTLSLHKNAIRTLPRDLISLENLTEVSDKKYFSYDFCLLIETLKLSLRDNPLVVRFVQGKGSSWVYVGEKFLMNFPTELSMTPTSLKEISARVVKTWSIPFGPQELPRTVIDYLSSANCCVNPDCKGKTHELSASELIAFSTSRALYPLIHLRVLHKHWRRQTLFTLWPRARQRLFQLKSRTKIERKNSNCFNLSRSSSSSIPHCAAISSLSVIKLFSCECVKQRPLVVSLAFASKSSRDFCSPGWTLSWQWKWFSKERDEEDWEESDRDSWLKVSSAFILIFPYLSFKHKEKLTLCNNSGASHRQNVAQSAFSADVSIALWRFQLQCKSHF